MAHNDFEDEALITDDPVYGTLLANYPSDRGRLLLVSGGIYLVISLVLNLAFARVDAALASIFVIGGMSLAALLIGWYVLHLWNREVVLYAHGFSYREGSRVVFFAYPEIHSVRQRAERFAYFGGLLHRTIQQIILKTDHGETIVLDGIYRRIEELSLRLEQLITQTRLPVVEAALSSGAAVSFGEPLALSAEGIKIGDRLLVWNAVQDFKLGSGSLIFNTASEPLAVPLAALENVGLLLTLLRSRTHRSTTDNSHNP